MQESMPMAERVPLLVPVSQVRAAFKQEPELQSQYGITGTEDDAALEARWQELGLPVRRDNGELFLGFFTPSG